MKGVNRARRAYVSDQYKHLCIAIKWCAHGYTHMHFNACTHSKKCLRVAFALARHWSLIHFSIIQVYQEVHCPFLSIRISISNCFCKGLRSLKSDGKEKEHGCSELFIRLWSAGYPLRSASRSCSGSVSNVMWASFLVFNSAAMPKTIVLCCVACFGPIWAFAGHAH